MTKAMWALLVSSTMLAASPHAMAGNTRTIIGRATEIRPEPPISKTDEATETVVIKTKREGEVSVGVGSRTRYLKWVTRKPWQQDTRANASFLRVGKLVAVEVGVDEDRPIARLVRIATE